MTRFTRAVLIAVFLGMLAIPNRLVAAQEKPAYTLIDLGTFGGPNSYFSIPSPLVNNRGTVIGLADTTMTDPFAPNNCFNPDCYTSPAFAWRDGVLTNLGALPGAYNSFPNWITPNGLIAGASENGVIDPLTGFPELRAVLWKDGKILNLGTFGGNWSLANAVNDRGQVVGEASNAISDPFASSLGIPNFGALGVTQNRAFLWQNGHMQDLGTLGSGNDAMASTLNERGQVAGWSTTSSTPNPTTGVPTVEPFFWQHGKMVDMGTLGGTIGYPFAMNSRGEVAGQSNLVGDQTFHPFLWSDGKLVDLGTFGGNDGFVNWLTDTGQAIGWAEVPIPCPGPPCAEPGNQVYHAASWQHGQKTDLGTLPGYKCSVAFGGNAAAQIVGTAGLCHGGLHAVLWQHGSMYDLNSLVGPFAAGQTLVEARNINDRGEIVATLAFASGNEHLVLLTPKCQSDGVANSNCNNGDA